MELKENGVTLKEKSNKERFEGMFDSLLSNSYITKEITIKDTKFSFKPLTTEEYLDAEAVYVSTVNGVSQDVVARARTVSTLAQALVSINDVVVVEDADSEKDIRAIRGNLRQLLLKLPPSIIDRMFLTYVDVMNEQAKMYDELVKDVENF